MRSSLSRVSEANRLKGNVSRFVLSKRLKKYQGFMVSHCNSKRNNFEFTLSVKERKIHHSLNIDSIH